ncbi:uncharacterized protein LOC114177307 isoform X3 [Vigna unguiculata]|uniref:uncharacterized protein LOC114177307 isoform X3 n=1 Tax=Vigna unguiculata TaxID=3917 RepID=UPI001015DFA5|nr:uncharacterized protein LOC114177307 isoform X3 [Vigna unguiculata]
MANVEILFLLLTLKLMSLPYITEGEEHVVGGNSGWIIPVNNPSLYSSFAASTTFRVNDTLETLRKLQRHRHNGIIRHVASQNHSQPRRRLLFRVRLPESLQPRPKAQHSCHRRRLFFPHAIGSSTPTPTSLACTHAPRRHCPRSCHGSCHKSLVSLLLKSCKSGYFYLH